MGRLLVSLRIPPEAVGPLVLLGGLCLLLVGCGSSSFVGQKYDDFTAYYNTFYNARQAFEKGAKAVQNTDRPVERGRYLPVFLAPEQQTGPSAFEDAIQKSAGVLREHPDSKWVDDALLIIGKSYYYQQNYVGAAQKFREVLALEGARETEARFWLARTLVTNGSISETAEVLRAGGERADDPWTARMQLVQGELLVRQEQWTEAESALERGLEGPLPDAVAARGAFLLGQVRETLGRPAEARRAYRRVQEHDPAYELSIAARLSDIELQGQHADASEALDRLRDLRKDDKNLDKLGEIAIVEARVYRAMGRYAQARVTLRRMLYRDRDRRASAGTAQGRLHYDLATLYRDAYQDFSRAAAHFDTASTTLSGGGRGRSEASASQRLPSAPVDPASQADRYRSLAERSREVARLDSLLRIGQMSDPAFQAFVQTLRERRRAQREAPEASSGEAARRRRFGGQEEAAAQRRRASASAAETRSSEAGFLFYKDPARVQQGRRRFEQTWGERPRVDNWRRRDAMQTAQASEASPDDAGPAPTPDSTRARRGSEPALDLSAIPRDSASLAEMEADRAQTRYELANALFLAAGQPDSAATWYRRILQEDGDQPVARRALYALGEAYRAQGDTTAAQQAYERLVQQYPEFSLARRARQRLGRPVQAVPENPSVRADSAYARAYEQWQEGTWRPALQELLSLARRYPDTDAAPRALLASGIIYWQRLQDDSLRAPRGPVQRYLRSRRDADSTGGDSPGVALTESGQGRGARPLAEDSTVRASADSGRLPTPARDTVATDTPARDASVPDASAAETKGADSVSALSMAGLGGGDPVAAVGLVADSTQWSWGGLWPDTAGVDSAARRPDPYPPLRALLTHLTERYPEAPPVQRARTMLSLIDQRTASPDSVAVEDSMAADSAQAPASRPDTTALAAADTTARPAPDTAGASRAGRSPLPSPNAASPPAETGGDAPSQGAPPRGWTLFVESFPSATEASNRASALRRQLQDRWPVEAVPDPAAEDETHLLLVGQFGSRQAATQVRGALEEQLSRRLEVRRMPGGR
jgi:tetratricopeptide (TPR) repeat protein